LPLGLAGPMPSQPDLNRRQLSLLQSAQQVITCRTELVSKLLVLHPVLARDPRLMSSGLNRVDSHRQFSACDARCMWCCWRFEDNTGRAKSLFPCCLGSYRQYLLSPADHALAGLSGRAAVLAEVLRLSHTHSTRLIRSLARCGLYCGHAWCSSCWHS
jgi:hypothetical protein